MGAGRPGKPLACRASRGAQYGRRSSSRAARSCAGDGAGGTGLVVSGAGLRLRLAVSRCLGRSAGSAGGAGAVSADAVSAPDAAPPRCGSRRCVRSQASRALGWPTFPSSTGSYRRAPGGRRCAAPLVAARRTARRWCRSTPAQPRPGTAVRTGAGVPVIAELTCAWASYDRRFRVGQRRLGLLDDRARLL